MTPSSDNPGATGPMVSTKRELRKLGTNTQATAAELKAFLAELKGRSPQEMLGIVASSQLIRSLVLSTIAVFVLILIFTIIPYFRGGSEKTGTPVAEAQVSLPAPTPTPAQPKPENPENPGPANPAQPEANPTQPDVSPLGVNEEKTAPPNVNPLEGGNENFLDGLDN